MQRLSVPFHRLAVLAVGLLAATCAWAQGLPPAPAASVGMSAQKLGRIATAFKQEIDAGKFPGAVMLVARRGKLVYAEAVGMQDQASGTPMAKDSLFRIYSMTKPLVSVAAMMLVEESRLQLTVPVSKHLPAFKGLTVSTAKVDPEFARITYTQVPAEREMTVQDLLRHTAGLAYGEITQNTPVKDALGKAGIYKTAIDYDARDLAPAEQVERLSKVPLAHQPGTYWEYSLASDVLGRVVEAAAGERLGDFLDKRLFKPLKMGDTAFWVPQSKLARLAQPLAADPIANKPIVLIDVSTQPANDSGGAGAVSTAGDYLRFAQMLLNGGQLDGARVMSRSSIALMNSDHLGTRIAAPTTPGELLLGVPGYTFGLGFAVRQGAGVAGVPGSAGEFMWAGYAGTYFWVDPKEELTAVMMMQAPSPIRPYFRRMFKQLVYAAIED
jgi:CubicO group peptidase (beta-lactamase class C family)